MTEVFKSLNKLNPKSMSVFKIKRYRKPMLSVVQAKEADQIISDLNIWTDYLHNLKVAQNGYMEK